jgi:alpha-mannosidase
MSSVKKSAYTICIVFFLANNGLFAQSNYRPNGSKNTDHSYFKNGTISIVNSSHQDIAWMDSIGACVAFRDEKMLTPVLNIMKINPDFCFSVENALSLKEYLSRHPDRYDEILQRTREGRLEWGATYNCPYESMYDGEALIRETYLGRKWLKRMLPGGDFLTAWNVDVPSRALQMPQILAKAGIKYLNFSRFEPGIYRWYSPDGSSILGWTPGQYYEASLPLVNAKTDEDKKHSLIKRLNEWDVYYKTGKIKPALPYLVSMDWSEPNEFASLINLWNKDAKKDGLPILKHSGTTASFKAFDTPGAHFEELSGERPDEWLYIHGPTHERALTASRTANRTLTAAEKFAAIKATIKNDFTLYPQNEFTTAWEDAIYPDHGWGGKHGDMTDLTFRTKFEDAYKISNNILQNSLSSISKTIGFNKNGKNIVVFNPLSWERSDEVEVSLSVYGQDTMSYKVFDAVTNKEVPSQLIARKPVNGYDETITLVFVAEKVPSVGYKTYYMEPYAAELKSGVPVYPTNPSLISSKADSDNYENKFYRIQFGEGGLKSIFDKGLNKELLNTKNLLGGEIFQMESIGYGAGEFSAIQPVTMNGFEKVSQYKPKWNCSEYGPVRKTWELTQQTKFAKIHQTVTLYDNLKQIDFKVEILGFSGERYREYRLAFPLAQGKSKVAYEVPMGVVEVGKNEIKGAAGFSKPDQIYSTPCKDIHPREVQDWFNSSSDDISVTISSSVAVFDWIDPTDKNNSSAVLQPILLASRKSCNSEGNYYLQPGNHSYQFTLTSNEGDWHNSVHTGKQQNQPLLPVMVDVDSPRNGLPLTKSFAGVNADNIIISAIKKSEDENSIIMRLVDMQGKSVDATVNWFGKVNGVNTTNIIEEEDKPLAENADAIKLFITPFSIDTIRIR